MFSSSTRPLSLTPYEVNAIITVRLAADGFSNDPKLETFLRRQASSNSFTLSPSETALVGNLRELQAKWSDKTIAATFMDARIDQAVRAARERSENGGWKGFGLDSAPPQASTSRSSSSRSSGFAQTQVDVKPVKIEVKVEAKPDIKPWVPKATKPATAATASATVTTRAAAAAAPPTSRSGRPLLMSLPAQRSVASMANAKPQPQHQSRQQASTSTSTSQKTKTSTPQKTKKNSSASGLKAEDRLSLDQVRAKSLGYRIRLTRNPPRDEKWRRELTLFPPKFLQNSLTTVESRHFLRVFDLKLNVPVTNPKPALRDIDQAISILDAASTTPEESKLYKAWGAAGYDGEVMLLAARLRELLRRWKKRNYPTQNQSDDSDLSSDLTSDDDDEEIIAESQTSKKKARFA